MFGNLPCTKSDHLPHVLFILSMFSILVQNPTYLKEAGQTYFVMKYFDKDRNNILNLKHGNVNVSMENFVNNITDLLEKHAPFKRISKYKLKFKTKPWITVALQKSVSIKSTLFKRYIKLKSPVMKD